MQISISVVSHGHFSIIDTLGCIDELSKKNWIKICIVDNIGESGFNTWCEERNIIYIKNNKKLGFGRNNNIAFDKLKNSSEHEEYQYFLVLNPDVSITIEQLEKLMLEVVENQIRFCCINLFKDFRYSDYDNSIRNYPGLFDFISSFVFSINKTIINKSCISHPQYVDWASGSFLLFDSKLFESLSGFDEKYFMYCEDIDICFRARLKENCKLLYMPEIKAVHLAAHNNRKILSRHFIWHVRSIFRYLVVKNLLLAKKYFSDFVSDI
ncbi:glycosyltransferase [Escherichia albertii]|uniref:glycosyltransferase n=1 Tax=Escherichia albertii TaxID=208962 RepID=UPI0010F7280B|nr:glycosyltransferase family 2 protein [Escherichia albertii]MCU7272569.1 glycosyltransferase family 2 protein [Escherichia albertii]